MILAYEFTTKSISFQPKKIVIEPMTYPIDVFDNDTVVLKYYQTQDKKIKISIETDEDTIYIYCSAMNRIHVFRNDVNESEEHYCLLNI